MTVAYIVAVLVIRYLVGRKKKYPDDTVQEKPEYIVALLTALGKTAVGVAVVYFGFAVFFCDVLLEDYWLFFGEKRTAEIESRYGIVVDDDVKLRKYKVVADMEGAVRTLEFESAIDGAEFMQKNCQGELVKYVEDDVCYNLKYPDTEPYAYTLEDNQAGIYCYEYQNRSYSMVFYYDSDGYRVKIN